jgi:hypothetical protein
VGDEFLTPQQVSQLVNIPLKGLEARRHRRQEPTFYRAGRKIRYRRSEVIAWMEKGRVPCGT